MYLTNWRIAVEMEMTCGDLFINLGFSILLGDLSDFSDYTEFEDFDHQVMMWLTEDWISCKKQLPWLIRKFEKIRSRLNEIDKVMVEPGIHLE